MTTMTREERTALAVGMLDKFLAEHDKRSRQEALCTLREYVAHARECTLLIACCDDRDVDEEHTHTPCDECADFLDLYNHGNYSVTLVDAVKILEEQTA